jgi:2'-5' RNA ligase
MPFVRRVALVAYVRTPAGEFIQRLQREVHPEAPVSVAHLTLLPPRPFEGSEVTAVQGLNVICRNVPPFDVTMGDVETFAPTTPTIFIRIAQSAERVLALHNQVNSGVLAAKEQWTYTPHLTIAKMASEAEAREATPTAQQLWLEFQGSRTFPVRELTLVREEEPACWVDIANIPLGRS